MIIFPGDIPSDKLPTVTVLIANWNYGKYIDGAIKSALKQNYPKLKIVVIDDYSTDDSWTVIKTACFDNDGMYKTVDKEGMTLAYSMITKGISILAIKLKSHVGVSAARNIAIELTQAETDMYQILDADDQMYETKVTELAGALFMSPAVGVAYGDYDILNVETGNVIREFKEPYDKERLLQECIVHSGAMIRKEALLATKEQWGYMDSRLRTCEDFDLWLRMSEKYIITHVPLALTLVRVHKNNATYTVPNQIWQTNRQLVYEKLKARYGQV